MNHSFFKISAFILFAAIFSGCASDPSLTLQRLNEQRHGPTSLYWNRMLYPIGGTFLFVEDSVTKDAANMRHEKKLRSLIASNLIKAGMKRVSKDASYLVRFHHASSPERTGENGFHHKLCIELISHWQSELILWHGTAWISRIENAEIDDSLSPLVWMLTSKFPEVMYRQISAPPEN